MVVLQKVETGIAAPFSPTAMKCSLLSALLFVSDASAFHLPFTKHIANSKHEATIKLNTKVFAQAGSLGLENTANNFYSAVLTVGGKGIDVVVL